nr:hypothetical protein [uncultured Marinifilum sp.]
MKLTIDKKEYELIIASDVIRDGIGLEIWEKSSNSMIVEIFRNDSKRQIEFFSEKVDVPLDLIEKSIEIFNEKIGRDFQD